MTMNADLNLNVTRRSEKDMPMKMKSGHHGSRRLALVIALAVTAVPLAAHAQRKSPLADAPAVRRRFELRTTRLEVGVGFGSTINQDFYHTMFLGLKAGFHINDWLSISAFGDFAVANVATTFQNDVVGSLSASNPSIVSEPTKGDAVAAMQKIKSMLGAQLEITPFTGKYSLFGKLFAHYDFYGFGGVGVINVEPTDAGISACESNNSSSGGGAYFCGVSGAKIGPTFGLGLHSFFNHWLALNVELRDIMAKLNPSGRDTDGNLNANTSDLTWTHTVSVAANLVFFLPSTPSISP